MGEQECRHSVTRRRVLMTSGVLAAGVVAGCATAPVYHVASTNRRVLIDPAGYSELAQPGGMVQLRVDHISDPIVLVRQEDSYLALSAVCTHLGCDVRPSKHFLVCPCHGSTFDLEGKAVRGPAEQPLSPYRTEVSADGIEIFLD